MTYEEWTAWGDELWAAWNRIYIPGVLVSIATTGGVWAGVAFGMAGLIANWWVTATAPIERPEL